MSLRLFSNATRRARTNGTGLPLSDKPSSAAFSDLENSVANFSKEYRNIQSMPVSEERISKTLDFVTRASEMRFRVPVRDAIIEVVPVFVNLKPMRRRDETVSSAVQILNLSGKGMVYVQELFEYCFEMVEQMSPHDLSMFIYECGRHGLRSKHYLDSALSNSKVLRIADKMTQEDILRSMKGLCKFASDYQSFISKQVNRLPFANLRAEDTLVLMRVLRGIGDARLFTKLIRSAEDFKTFSLREKYSAIYLSKRSKNFRLQSRDLGAMAGACRSLVGQVSHISISEMRDELITTDMTDALDAMASLKIRNDELLAKIMQLVVERVAEIRYSPICGLWQSITDSLGHLQYFHGGWMRIVEELASSEFNLKSFASFQLIFFTSSLGRLHFFSPKIFTALTNVLKADIRSVNDPDMLGTLMFPLERAAFACPELVDAVVTQTFTINQKLNTLTRSAWRGTLSVIYTSVCLGVDVKDPRIRSLAEKIFNRDLDLPPEYLTDQDYSRVARLRYFGVPLEVPKLVEDSPKFALWPNIAQHAELVISKIGDTEPRSDFITCMSQDGVPIIVDSSFQDEVMYSWALPNDERNFELLRLQTTGTRQAIERHLKCKNGFEKISFVS